MKNCEECQWSWLSEKGDKYDEPDYMICDNGASYHCGRIVGKVGEPYEIDCEDFEEPL